MRSRTERRKEDLEEFFGIFSNLTHELINNPNDEEIFIFNESFEAGEWISMKRCHAVELAEMNLEFIMKRKKQWIEEGSYSEDGSKLLTEDVEECGYESVKAHHDAIHEIFKKVDSLKSYSEFST